MTLRRVRLDLVDLHGDLLAVRRDVRHRFTDGVAEDGAAERAALAVDVEVAVFADDLAASEEEHALVAEDACRHDGSRLYDTRALGSRSDLGVAQKLGE